MSGPMWRPSQARIDGSNLTRFQAQVKAELERDARTRVVLVEDVVTTGGSGLIAAERIEEEGYVIAGMISMVDREEGAREAIEARGYKFEALFTKTEIRG